MKKIKHSLVNGIIKEIVPRIYCVQVDDDYDRAMLFCRYQEYYESPYKKFRGKYFTWMEYMKFYKDAWKKDIFTYPVDWSGYNIPSNILEGGVDAFYKETEYDHVMNDIYFYCDIDSQNKNDGTRCDWYLIGASSKDKGTINHEIAHGLYYTNNEYKKIVTTLIRKIKATHYDKLKNKLVKMGYVDDKKIIDDEIQAFMSTGLYNGLDTIELKKYERDFIKNFKNFNKL
jgi:hypothetical protein